MNNNPLDSFPYLQQMAQQFRQMFGDDFVKNMMNSMQVPTWNQPMGNQPMGNQGGPGGNSEPSGSESRFGQNPFQTNGNGQAQAGGGAWPNWMAGFNPQASSPNPSSSFAGIAADVFDMRNEVVVIVELPGLQKASDVRISVLPTSVTIKGDRRRGAHTAAGTITQSERALGPFERTIELPARVRKQHAKATYAHGLLEIRLVKEGRIGNPDANMVDVDFL